MSSQIAAIAEAVKTSLNAAQVAGDFSPHAFTAQRVYVPLKTLEAVASLQVLVVPKNRELSKSGRARTLQRDVMIDVGILKRVSADPTTEAACTEIDPLLELAEKIADHYGAGESAGDGQWFATENLLLFDPDMLRNNKAFLTVVTFSFRVM